MRPVRTFILVLLFWPLAPAALAASTIADKPEDVRPIMVGEKIPRLTLTSIDNKRFDLNKALASQPTLLIFYRGGWCPYCNTHLADLRKIENELDAKGVQILAISPDLPKYLRETDEKHHPAYQLLSDSKMKAAEALGLAYTVSGGTRIKYKAFGIDLERNSGEDHHLLPVPAAILVDTSQRVSFIFYAPDYKIRVENSVILAAVDALLAKSTGQ